MKNYRFFTTVAMICGLFFTGACSVNKNTATINNNVQLNDAIVAVRLNPYLRNFDRFPFGYLILANSQGETRKFSIDGLETGKLFWNNTGLFFSQQDSESILSAQGFYSLKRKHTEEFEEVKFALPNEHYFSLYDSGNLDSVVAVGNPQSVTSWRVPGMYSGVSYCAGKVIGLTSELGVGSSLESTLHKSLVQLYPKPDKTDPLIPPVDFSANADWISETAIPCLNNVVHALNGKYHKTAETESVSLHKWDIATGTHTVLPLTDVKQQPLQKPMTDSSLYKAIILNDTYIWVTPYGKVFSTDLKTGITQNPYSLKISDKKALESQIILTDKSVFVLDVSYGIQGLLTLYHYDLQSGQVLKKIEIPNVQHLYNKSNQVIRDFALSPAWIAEQESKMQK